MIVQANCIRQRLGKSWRILRCISEIEITGMRCRRGEEGSDWSSEYCVDVLRDGDEVACCCRCIEDAYWVQ